MVKATDGIIPPEVLLIRQLIEVFVQSDESLKTAILNAQNKGILVTIGFSVQCTVVRDLDCISIPKPSDVM